MSSEEPVEKQDPSGDDDDPGLDLEVLRRRRETVLTILALIVVLVAGGGTAWYVLHTNPVADTELINAAQNAVREYLGPGLTLQFSSRTETQIERLAPQKYSVAAQVVAITELGQAQGYLFTCALERLPDGRWGPSKLSVNPR